MPSYEQLSREELITKINELESMLQMLRDEKDNYELLHFPWIGDLGNWYWWVNENRVIHNFQKIAVLGYAKEEVPGNIGFSWFTEKLHPDDYEPVMENMRRHLYGQSPAYEVTYRIQTKNGGWKWFYDRGKVTRRSESGKPELVAGIVFDVTEQKRMEQLLLEQNAKLTEMSRTDFLTKASSRNALFERLELEIERAKRNQSPFSILMIDIDHFKKINDTHGHLAGDQILRQVSAVLRESVRASDTVGRYGGEEFLVVLPGCRLADAVSVAEKARQNIASAELHSGIQARISVGAQEYAGETAEVLIEKADRCLYHAKRSGRNRVVASLPDSEEEAALQIPNN